jgi:uncharacterized protein (TIGR03905 family)
VFIVVNTGSKNEVLTVYTYLTEGTCSTSIDIDVRDGVIQSVQFHDGCDGNLRGISMLLPGMRVEDAISKLQGIQCQNGTSCPDQLTRALARMRVEGLA